MSQKTSQLPAYEVDREQNRRGWDTQRRLLQTPMAPRSWGAVWSARAGRPADAVGQEVFQTQRRRDPCYAPLKWIALLLFLQCFVYKDTNFVPSLEIGVSVTPDRLVSIIILVLAVWRFTRGELRFPTLGKAGYYMLLFAVICTVSSFMGGAVSRVLDRLFDFNYNPFVLFILAKSITHSRKKLAFLSCAFLAVGVYLAINGIFERFGPHVLVWPKYILDRSVGIQFGRTRGSFVSSEALGQALAVIFLFYALYINRLKGIRFCWAYLMMLALSVVVYTTNQRAAWISFAICLVVLAITKTEMKRLARVIVGVALLGFLSGVGSHFSFWETTMFSRRQNTVDYRKVNTLTSLAMIQAHPIVGIGFGNYRSMWPQYFQPVEGIDLRELDDGNHNTFLGLFAETGLVGFLSYLIIFYYMLRVGLQVYRKGEQFEREFALVFLLVMTVFIFGGNFSDYRSERFLNATLFLLFGTVAGIKVNRASVTPRSVAALCRLCRFHSPRWPLVDAPQDVGVRAGPFSQGRKCFCLVQRDKWGGRRHGRGR